MQEAFIKVFSTGDFSQTIALIIILLLTFLLGMFVWAVLAHFPAARQLKISNKELTASNTTLEKDNKDLSERYTVINAKHNRCVEDLQTAEANLKEKNEKVEEQSEKIGLISDQLELYKESSRNAKEANESLLEEYKKMSKENEKYLEQVEEMKAIVEEVEGEKKELVKQEKGNALGLREQENKLKTTTENLEKAKNTIDLLKKDLDAALAQKAELKKELLNLEATVNFEETGDHDLKTQLVGLKSHIRDLETENTDLMERLAPYLAKEQDEQKNDAEIEALLVDLLVDAEQNMEQDGFYVDYHENDLIEDKKYLEKVLGEEATEGLPKDETPMVEVELDLEDEEALDAAMKQAEIALTMQGFYGDVDKAVLLAPDEEEKVVSDDDLMEQQLDDTAKMIANALFFSEEADEEGFVENEGLLKNELAKINFVEHPADAETEVITLEDSDHSELDAALENAMEAMKAEGLYSPIDSEKLIGTDDEEEIKEKELQASDLEKAVVQEIGRSIPVASKSKKNDLQKIDGIGMFVEEQLNRFGIYTYEQISQFDEAFIAKLGAALGFSEQSIARDKWVEQAKNLLEEA